MREKPYPAALTAQGSTRIDRVAEQKFDIAPQILMENAGRAVASEACSFLRRHHRLRVAIFCGKGNNGGDGFVAARHLLAEGIKPDIFAVGALNDATGGAAINRKILVKLTQKIVPVTSRSMARLRSRIHRYGFIIDGLLGVGLCGEVSGLMREVIEAINLARVPVLAIDIPSGLDATTGEVRGVAVKAERTVTFMAVKRGMLIAEGPRHCGRVKVAGLGFPYRR
jgi:hydroxyethylthiazole kinase-like uncharacterized protein yjeF